MIIDDVSVKRSPKLSVISYFRNFVLQDGHPYMGTLILFLDIVTAETVLQDVVASSRAICRPRNPGNRKGTSSIREHSGTRRATVRSFFRLLRTVHRKSTNGRQYLNWKSCSCRASRDLRACAKRMPLLQSARASCHTNTRALIYVASDMERQPEPSTGIYKT